MKPADLKKRLQKWKPPDIPPDAVPRGVRAFTAEVRAIKGGGFRTGYRDD